MGIAGWEVIMSGLEGCPRLSTLDGVSCAGMVTGGLVELALSSLGEEAGLALAAAKRFLSRSYSTLETLDLR